MGRPRGKALSLDAVLTAARAVLERDGFVALTLSNVARELGIKPPSVCHHVPTNQDLRLELAQQSWLLLGDQLNAAAAIPEPRERLGEYARTARRFALSHPRTFELMILVRVPHSRVLGGPLGEKLLSPLIGAFRELGLRGPRLLHAARALRSAVTGFLLLEITGQFQMQGATQRSLDQMIEALLDGFSTAGRRARSERARARAVR